MIKKYFAMTVIALSVSLAACSDDDDDKKEVTTPVGGGDNTVNPPAEVMLTATVDSPAVTIYDSIGGSDDHTTLLAALNANPALANAADDGTAPLTVIAPDNAAFDALVTAAGVADVAGLLALNDGATVTRTLEYHIMSGIVALSDTTPPTDTLLVDDGTAAQLTFVAGTGGTGVAVVDAAETPNTIDLAEVNLSAQGNLYSVSTVLTPPAAPEPPVVVVVDPGSGLPAAVQSGGANAIIGQAFVASFSGQFTGSDVADPGNNSESELWTFFVPTDAALPTGSASDIVLAGYVHTGGALGTTELADGSSVAMADNTSAAVTNDGTVITVGGATATQIGTSPQGGIIYSLDAVFQAAVLQ